MPQELSTYNLPVPYPNRAPVVLNPAPVPQAPQFNLPSASPAPMPQATPVQQPKPPQLYEAAKSLEAKLGRAPTPEEYGNLVDGFWTGAIAPIAWHQRGATQGSVGADEAAFKQRALGKYGEWFGGAAQAQPDSDMGWWNTAYTAAKGGLQHTFGGASAALGGVISLGGTVPSAASDFLISQANPNRNAGALNIAKQLEGQRQKLLAMYPQNAARINAQLVPQIKEQIAAAGNPNLVQMGAANTQLAESAGHPSAAFLGHLGGQIAPFFIPGAQVGVAAGEAVGNVTAHSADQLSAGQDPWAVARQAPIDAELQTLAAFLPIKVGGKTIRAALEGDSTLAKFLANSPKFKKFIEGDSATARLVNSDSTLGRGVKGGTLGAAVGGTQQIADVAVNKDNKVDLGAVGLQTAISAGLSALLGGKGGGALLRILSRDKLKKKPEVTETPKPEEAPVDTGPGTPQYAANWQKAQDELAGMTAVDSEGTIKNADTIMDTLSVKYGVSRKDLESATSPEITKTGQTASAGTNEGYNEILAAAPEEGIADDAFAKLDSSVAKTRSASYKKYQKAVNGAKTPEKVLDVAIGLAKRFAGKQWDNLNAEQRGKLIGDSATWVAGKSKVPAEDVTAHLETLQATPEPVPAAANAPETAPAEAQATPEGASAPTNSRAATPIKPASIIPAEAIETAKGKVETKTLRTRASSYRNAADNLLNEGLEGNKEKALDLHDKADKLDVLADQVDTVRGKLARGEPIEQPLPAGIKGTQVPDTVASESVKPINVVKSKALKDKKITVRNVIQDAAAANTSKQEIAQLANQLVSEAERSSTPIDVWANDAGNIQAQLPHEGAPTGSEWRKILTINPKSARNQANDALWLAANMSAEPKTGGEIIHILWQNVHDGTLTNRAQFDTFVAKATKQAQNIVQQRKTTGLANKLKEQVAEQPTTKEKLVIAKKATPLKNKQKQASTELRTFFNALHNAGNKTDDAAELAIREHPYFDAAKDEFGKSINTPEDLKVFLDELGGKDKFGQRFDNLPKELKNNKVGDLIKSKKDRNNTSRRAARQLATDIRDLLTSGKNAESIQDINNMPLAKAYSTLNKHVTQLQEAVEAAVPKKKGLKGKAKTTKGNALKKEIKPPPKSEAPVEEAGANENSFLTYFQKKLPQDDLAALHDAYQEAITGHGREAVNVIIKDLKQGGLIADKDIKVLNRLIKDNTGKEASFNDIVQNNASLDNKASIEGVNRVAREKKAGQTRAVIERNGQARPLIGVDAADTHPRPGQVIAQRNLQGDGKWSVIERADDISKAQDEGIIARAKKQLDEIHEDQANPESTRFDEPTSTQDVVNYAQLRNDINTKIEAPKQEPIKRLNTINRVDKAIKEIQEGKDVREVGRTLLDLRESLQERATTRAMRGATHERRRGPDWVRARLARELADLPEGRQRAGVELGLWALEQNPNIANEVAISIRKLPEGAAGGFSKISRIIELSKSEFGPRTVVHEILHAAEELMPKELQDKIFGEYIGRLLNKIKQQKKNGNLQAVTYLQKAVEQLIQPSEQGRKELVKMLVDNPKLLPANEYYKYSSPSEYWAEEGSAILKRRHDADSWIAKAKNWMEEFIEHVKGVFGADSSRQVLKGLKDVLKSEGEFKSDTMIEKRGGDFSDIDKTERPRQEDLGYEVAEYYEKPPELHTEINVDENTIDLSKVTRFQQFIEGYTKASFALEKATQKVRKLGIKVNEDNNLDDAVSAKRGAVSENNSIDKLEVVDAVDDYVHDNYSRYASSPQEFYTKLDDFFGNTNRIEREITAWIHNAPLKGSAELDRADILNDVAELNIKPEAAYRKLNALANNSAEMTWQEFSKHRGFRLDEVQERLDKLDKLGINQKSMAELNKLLGPVRDRAIQRLQESGWTSADDPWIKVYNWKWYVPIKGSAYGGKESNNFDIIPDRSLSTGILNKAVEVMQGRKTWGERPFLRLLIDLNRAGERAANKKITDAAYELELTAREAYRNERGSIEDRFASDADRLKIELDKIDAKYRDILAKNVQVFTGRAHDGFVNEDTEKWVPRLPKPKYGLIVPDGDTFYVLEYHPNSQIYRGLAQMDNVKKLGPVSGWVAKRTNVLARLYTTMIPRWQTFTGAARDFTYIPGTAAATLYRNPFESIPFVGDYIKEALQLYKAAPTIIPTVVGNRAKLIELAKADPESYAGYVRRFEKAGGSALFTEGFDIPSMERVLGRRLSDIHGLVDAGKFTWEQALKYTGNYANLLERLSRIAMFKTLIKTENPETGKLFTDSEAAIFTRKLLDYSESGIEGRRINAWLAFFRVGMTGADAMRRAFTKPTGEFDRAKFLAWQGFGAAMGAGLYMMYMALLGEDEVKKIPLYDLTSSMVFPLGDGIGKFNIGLGLPQLMLAPGILTAAVTYGNATPAQAAKEYWATLQRNGPLSPGGEGRTGNPVIDFAYSLAGGAVPTIVRPITDVGSNTSSFGAPIHSIYPDREQYHSDQGRFNTQKEYKEMATWLREASGGIVDMYPEDIKYLIHSYLGSIGSSAVQGWLTTPNVEAGGQQPLGKLAGSYRVDTSHYMQDQMFDTLDELRESQQRYEHLVRTIQDEGKTRSRAKIEASSIVARDPTFSSKIKAFKQLKNAHREYTKDVKAIAANKLISDTRKELQRKRLDSELRKQIEKAQTVLEP